jgi:hypothetical protein
MSSCSHQAFKSALRVDIGLSAVLRIFLITCYSLTGILCLTLSLDLPTRLVLCLFSVTYGLYLVWYKFGPHARSGVERIEYAENQGWHLSFAAGGQVTVCLRAPVFVTRFLVIARFGGGLIPKYTVVIPADAVDPHVFRHLRVRLLQSAHGDRN